MAYDLRIIDAASKILAIVRRETNKLPDDLRHELSAVLINGIPDVIDNLEPHALPPSPAI